MKKIAIIGNPNSGKTTLFNKLTGKNQHVGNWPGITIDKKVGTFTYKDTKFEITDLPGIYSLSTYTQEEIVSREYILQNKPDLILNIVDGLNLERNLYLTLQIKSLGIPMLTAVNFSDDLIKENVTLDVKSLSENLGINSVCISAKNSENLEALLNEIYQGDNSLLAKNLYSDNIQIVLDNIKELIKDKTPFNEFYASKILDGEETNLLSKSENEQIDTIIDDMSLKDRSMIMADNMYGAIEKIVSKCIKAEKKITITEKIDKILMHKFLCIPIFLLIMFTIFSITFGGVGSFFSDGIDVFINDIIASNFIDFLASVSAPEWFISLIGDGIIAGVGGILTFLPQIIILFLFLSLLEDSGYLARIAFIMDSLLNKIGLSGKSFIPMLMGFGCTTPAVMSARTMENEQDRKMTILITPFMSCSAKLPVYALFIGAFFTHNQGLITFSIYILGIIIAIISGLIFKATIFKGINSNFVLELPKYRLPQFSSTMRNVTTRAKDFIIKAGTIIFAMSVLIWFMQNFTPGFVMTDNTSESILGILGGFIAPIFTPLGFGTPEASVSLLTGLIAKESVVSTMGVLYSSGGDLEVLKQTLQNLFTPLSGYAFMAFTLLYVPCISAFATIKREMGSFKWALGAAAYQTGVAYIVALIIFQVGSLII